ncbi:PSA repeat domain-containing protein [Desulforhopalus singaporensis]|uniref:Cytochrome c-552/4 domain-containing protein n=1 Tax=Desulforhopalus singaporensis TaxID=91360 RepID=A0A1H0TMJ2_9BACT|nr:PSA repeat domain-containing protein [Desulforhopalus singaporensis]SDP54756.1 hypothetical protein SAMN05660330_03138 [Desulforhopalus singaporensis]
MKKIIVAATLLYCFSVPKVLWGAAVVPPEIDMPGTQPLEVSLESPNRCLNCHKNYETNPRVEPGFGWMGGAMGNAGRDPIFWATLAIAEQGFDGVGDLCIRCHSAGGWIGGRSTPTDGSGLRASDENGIDCDTCHQMTNPDMGEHTGVMVDPFIANQGDSLDPAQAGEGYYGSGMYSMSNSYGKLGPYGDTVARHQFTESNFHRDVDFCGTCHDVSNPAVGDLAPNSGTQDGAPDVVNSWDFAPVGAPNPGGLREEKAAFNNPPYGYGIVERTFSEYKSSPLSATLVDSFWSLPQDLQDPRGSLYNAYMNSTTEETRSANYIDDATNPDETSKRYFSCQTCHMRAITGRGCDKNGAPNRLDQPMHDQTGGNYWVYPLVKYQDQQGTLRLGGGLTAEQVEALDDGVLRAKSHLSQAATLDVAGNMVRITNMTGHKLITGYPEGRRMWLNIKWYDSSGAELPDHEIGAWGPLVDNNGDPVIMVNPRDQQEFIPKSIINLEDPNLKVYEVHPAMTQEWADMLVGLGYPEAMPLSFDRITGRVDFTLGQLAALEPGSYYQTFHFALNNYVASDNRIPPYRMSYDEARKRNALPVPDGQYGGAPGGVYQHWDEFDIAQIAPQGAVAADLTLYYQGTSWEYVQFLYQAVSAGPGDPAKPFPYPVSLFLADEGKNFLDGWVNAKDANNNSMVPPQVMATAVWGSAACVAEPEICDDTVDNDCDGIVDCNDTDCSGTPECPSLIEYPFCFDGLDNDFDGAVDCDDRTDCDGQSETTVCGLGVCSSTGTRSCSNGTLVETVACIPLEPTEPNVELSCDDGLDNDCDGDVDFSDADCPVCAVYTDKAGCNGDPNCTWNGNPNTGSCQEIQVTQCSDFVTRSECLTQPSCTWDNKTKTCVSL